MKKLSLAAVALLLLLIVTSPVTMIWLIKQEASGIMSDSLQGLTTSSLATMHVSEGFLDTALAVNSGNVKADELLAQLEETTRQADEQYQGHRETLRTDAERRSFDRVAECRNAYRSSRKQVIELLGAGKKTEADAFFESDCVVKFQTYAEALGDLVEHNAIDARARGAEIIRLCYILLGVQLLLLAFFFVYGFFVPLTAILERLTRRPVVFRT
ncbi:MCP four helix bundle domain-containing protein [Luteolibacter marinus]|uniref:MCP four helix bundle domain-containing protein n=1 Tax=Luteolibacter marinus TaxID=2776705 RepID=UPI0018672175|nr:MCP four helix bundle domain-containing protein [Luteolibacter marinus]